MNVRIEEYQKTNKLAKEKSPYLLQHAHNPVDWYPWGEEAFEKAKREDKPVFLSIGYSTCHWCHVMERESFEDKEVAKLLNSHFIPVKVDREERPDVDHIYMSVCQALTGHGGWPLTVFLTPDKKPFYAGTYFPKNDHMGMPGLMTLLERIYDVWTYRRESLLESGEKMAAIFNHPVDTFENELDKNLIHEAYAEFRQRFDKLYGGFGSAPKFPTPHNLLFLLRYWHITHEKPALEMVEKTLEAMHKGGIYDHIGFGFSRYSTDRKWLVPHFEKMLYDNALLAIAYLEAWHVTKNEKYAEVARQIFTYVLRDMTSSEGCFYSAEDADSEGKEGKFYLWTPGQIKEVLGEKDGDRFCLCFDITGKGNFEGLDIPNLINSNIPDGDRDFIESCRSRLFEYRKKRVHPYKDDKILTSWNGLMIAALAVGGRILGDNKYTVSAEKAVQFILSKMVRFDGRLLARYRDGDAAIPAYLDDYAFLIWGLTELYEATYNPEYLQKAVHLNERMLDLFWDKEKGGMFLNGNDSEQLITRTKEIYDGAAPSGNSAAALNLLRLSRLTGEHELEVKALQLLQAFGKSISSYPPGHSFSLITFMFLQAESREVVVVEGRADIKTNGLLDVIKEEYSPFTVSMFYSSENEQIKSIVPFIANYVPVNDMPAAYVCKNFACSYPVTDAVQLREMLQ